MASDWGKQGSRAPRQQLQATKLGGARAGTGQKRGQPAPGHQRHRLPQRSAEEGKPSGSAGSECLPGGQLAGSRDGGDRALPARGAPNGSEETGSVCTHWGAEPGSCLDDPGPGQFLKRLSWAPLGGCRLQARASRKRLERVRREHTRPGEATRRGPLCANVGARPVMGASVPHLPVRARHLRKNNRQHTPPQHKIGNFILVVVIRRQKNVQLQESSSKQRLNMS